MSQQPINEQIADKLTRHMVNLERFKAGEAKRIVEMLQRLARELEKEVLSSDLATAVRLSTKQRRLTALLQQTRATIKTYFKDLNSEVEQSFYELAKIESEMARSMINNPIGVEIASVALSPEQLKSIASDVMIEGARSSEFWSRQGEVLQQRFSDSMRQGMLRGEGVDELTRRVRGTKANAFKDGIMNITKRNAEALVRTSVQTVATKAQEELYLNNQDVIKGIQHRSTLDLRTTDICIARSGKVWLLPDYKPDGHSITYETPGTNHWNCRSRPLPITKSWEELGFEGIQTGGRKARDQTEYFRNNLKKKFSAELKDGKITMDDIDNKVAGLQSSMNGYVPNDWNYETWLKTKSRAEQIEVLGKGKWKLWNQGKITLSQLIDESGRPMTLKELRAEI